MKGSLMGSWRHLWHLVLDLILNVCPLDAAILVLLTDAVRPPGPVLVFYVMKMCYMCSTTISKSSKLQVKICAWQTECYSFCKSCVVLDRRRFEIYLLRWISLALHNSTLCLQNECSWDKKSYCCVFLFLPQPSGIPSVPLWIIA